MPILNNGRYSNPWSTWKDPKLVDMLNYGFFTEDLTDIPDRDVKENEQYSYSKFIILFKLKILNSKGIE